VTVVNVQCFVIVDCDRRERDDRVINLGGIIIDTLRNGERKAAAVQLMNFTFRYSGGQYIPWIDGSPEDVDEAVTGFLSGKVGEDKSRDWGLVRTTTENTH
jgi:hypothetical protein